MLLRILPPHIELYKCLRQESNFLAPTMGSATVYKVLSKISYKLYIIKQLNKITKTVEKGDHKNIICNSYLNVIEVKSFTI
jgi:Fe2+ or Zn2+ uptake regulation protein